jgi:hypothetical protein
MGYDFIFDVLTFTFIGGTCTILDCLYIGQDFMMLFSFSEYTSAAYESPPSVIASQKNSLKPSLYFRNGQVLQSDTKTGNALIGVVEFDALLI